MVSRENSEKTFQKVFTFNKKSFQIWLYDKYSQTYCDNISNTLEKLFSNKINSIEDIQKLIDTNTLNKKSTSVSFRVFLNYCEMKNIFSYEELYKFRSRIKISNKNKIDSFVPEKKQIKFSINHIKKNYQHEYLFIYLILIESGIRYSELIEIILNYDSVKVDIRRDFIIYSNFYIRGKKSSYFLYSSKNTFEKLISLKDKLTYSKMMYFKKKVSLDENLINLKYLRKYNFTIMIKSGINFEIANFIQGRSSKNIGFNHYLAKKELAFENYCKFFKQLY